MILPLGLLRRLKWTYPSTMFLAVGATAYFVDNYGPVDTAALWIIFLCLFAVHKHFKR